VQLTVHTVAPTALTNAGLHLAASEEEAAPERRGQEIRVRVSNARQSLGEQFALHWETPSGPASDGEPIRVYVPPGESRVVRVPRLPGESAADRLVLTGDDHPFDNTLYQVPIVQEGVPIVYLGDDAADDPAGLRYYLERAFPDTAQRRIRWIAPKSGEPAASASGQSEALAARLAVVTRSPTDTDVKPLRDLMQRGGTVLLVLQDAASAQGLAKLMGLDHLEATEAATKDYAMFGEIDFTDPLFTAFADPRFNDFTKIYFWRHRRVNLTSRLGLRPDPVTLVGTESQPTKIRVLARFDDGDPAIFEQAQAAGRLLVLTAGWHPADSQLARSTKFVPLMSAVLEQSAARVAVLPQYSVGDPVLLPDSVPGESRSMCRARATCRWPRALADSTKPPSQACINW
jgi:hypothetical protein